MIKRLNKAKKNKQGAILVIVVLILALAMIFIASAMMLTQATRRRLYSQTMSSQARLTVTSASEVFLEALKTQEITDTQLEKIMNKTHGAGATKVKMVVPGVPGMSEANDNCTWLDIYTSASTPDYVYCDFTTVIGTSTENVQVVLKAEEEDPSYGSQFKNQVEVAGGVGVGELRFTGGVGMWDQTKIAAPTDNNIVLRGNYKGQTSDSLYLSDVVFGQDSNNVQLGGGEKFYGKMIFLQGAQMNCRSSAQVYGDIYLMGTDKSAGLAVKDSSQTGVWDNLAGKSNSFIFSGRKVQNDNNDGNKKVYEALTKNNSHKIYFVDGNGNSLGANPDIATGKANSSFTYTITNSAQSNPLSSTNKANVKRYLSWNYGSSNAFPSASQVFKKLCPDGKVTTAASDTVLTYTTYSPDGSKTYSAGSTIPAGAKYIVNPVTTSYPEYRKNGSNYQKVLNLSTVTSSQYLEPGYYYVTGNGTNVTGGGEAYRYSPIVLTIDGSKGSDYRFYFAANHNFLLRGLVFAIFNADSNKPVLFIMENGAKIQLSHNNDGLNGGHCLCSAGFLSVATRPGCDNSDNLINYVHTKTWTSEKHAYQNDAFKDYNGAKATSTYSAYYDNIVKPAMFIYGVGNNVFCIGKSVTIEAYIGLYGSSCFGPIDGSGDHQQIYGRIECQEFHTYKQDATFAIAGYDNPVGDFVMPYCPQPTSDDTMPKQRIAKSKYKVSDITYYY
ncbi:MAG: hypothetical protein IKT10_04080 [Clostridiales bacterium]|nr:hypothetical protein [Clostridiales bacterium]